MEETNHPKSNKQLRYQTIKKNGIMIVLLVISILMFCYMGYVLLKPEKF